MLVRRGLRGGELAGISEAAALPGQQALRSHVKRYSFRDSDTLIHTLTLLGKVIKHEPKDEVNAQRFGKFKLPGDRNDQKVLHLRRFIFLQ